MRFIDGLMAFPGILLAIMLVTVMGPGLGNTIIAIGIANVPVFARITRGVFLTGRNALYVEAAPCPGSPHLGYYQVSYSAKRHWTHSCPGNCHLFYSHFDRGFLELFGTRYPAAG